MSLVGNGYAAGSRGKRSTALTRARFFADDEEAGAAAEAEAGTGAGVEAGGPAGTGLDGRKRHTKKATSTVVLCWGIAMQDMRWDCRLV